MLTATQSTLIDRLEVKYLIDRPTRTALARDLQAFMRPDTHAGADGAYLVRSLYFDTHDYRAYHDKMAGAAHRHKLRVRTYGASPSQVRLEVKSRYLSYVYKHVVDVPLRDYAQIDRAIRCRVLPSSQLLASNNVLREFFRLQRQYNMEPKIIVQYRRQALERREIHRVRVNFDDELVATRNLDLLCPAAGARRLLHYGHAIFEVKVDNVMPFWLHNLIAKYDLRNQALSKYCYAVRSEARLSAVPRESALD